jgi:ABC-type nitrate/sulfonate/bicarbonate transport system permease component
MNLRDISPPALGQALRPNIWDVVALILVTGAMVLIVYGGEQTVAPLSALDIAPVTLDPFHLPAYALRTTMRMLLAIVCSIIFTFIYAALAAKSRRAEMVLIPLLDILQSVPILGFLTFTVVFFMNLFPGRVFGAELACVFAIFTSQAWNMTFSMYQSMRNVPKDLEEASQSFHLSGWQRFWRLDVPFAMPGLIWNTMMSMSGGWFFVVASEAITVGKTTVTLPGIGSYVALAIQQRNLPAIGYAILTMLLVIIAYDQLLFRPVVAWADKFRFEQTASGTAPTSWMLDLFRRTRALRSLSLPFAALNKMISNLHVVPPGAWKLATKQAQSSRTVDALWLAFIVVSTGYAAWRTYEYLSATLCFRRIRRVRLWPAYACPRHRADRAGHPDMGAGRGLDRTAAETRRTDPATGAVPGGISRQPRLSSVRGGDRALRPECQCLAEPADDPGHPVVHPVQCHCWRQRLSDRSARGCRKLPPQGLAMVGQGRVAGDLSLLRHRRDHRVGRLVERLNRRGSRKLGQYPSDRQRSRCLYSDRD